MAMTLHRSASHWGWHSGVGLLPRRLRLMATTTSTRRLPRVDDDVCSTLSSLSWKDRTNQQSPVAIATATQLQPLALTHAPDVSRSFATWSRENQPQSRSEKGSTTIALDDNVTLGAGDERMINLLIAYKERHGDCHVPAARTEFASLEGQRLGVSDELVAWVREQRRRYSKYAKSSTDMKSPPKQEHVLFFVLESIGFMFSENEAQWQRYFNRMEAYKAKHGTLNVDREIDLQLCKWMDQQRKTYQRGRLSDSRETLLREVEFVFDIHEAAWQEQFDRLRAYAKVHGTPNPPFRDPGGKDTRLGAWANRQRQHYHNSNLARDRVAALESIGFSWNVREDKWKEHYNKLVQFYSENGHTRVPVASGQLWEWVSRQRRKLRQRPGGVDEDKVEALEKLNFDWSIGHDMDENRVQRLMELSFSPHLHADRWVHNYEKLCSFYSRFGHFSVSPKDPEYEELSRWVKNQRFLKRRAKLPEERVAALEEIGFIWSGERARWTQYYNQLEQFHAEHGHTRVPAKFRGLYHWSKTQREALRDGDGGESSRTSVISPTDSRWDSLKTMLDDDGS